MRAWIARDRDKKIFAYNHKPVKIRGAWVCRWGVYIFPIAEKDLPEGINPQWEDEEPIKVELKIEKA